MGLYSQRIALTILLICLTVMVPCRYTQAQENDAARLTEYYLADISNDCKVVLENVEIFTDRDYPYFWENILSSNVEIQNATIDYYFEDIRRFNKIIDSLYEGYYLAVNRDTGEETEAAYYKKSAVLKNQIDQMFAYLYLTTCDFFKAYNLLDDPDLLATEHVLKLNNMVGQEYDFPLTTLLAERYALIKQNLIPLTLRLNNYYPSDISSLQPYLTFSNYEKLPPISRIYVNYYGDYMPWKGENLSRVLKISELIRFHDEINAGAVSDPLTGYAAPSETAEGGGTPAYSKTYVLPILKCDIDVTNNDESVRVKEEDGVITLEHKCLFKGFERTDFRILKMESDNPAGEQEADSAGLALKPVESDKSFFGNEKNEILPGDMMPYGLYDLYRNNELIGKVDLYPCRKGDICEKEASAEDITTIKVYDHELILNKDIIDQVYRKNNLRRRAIVSPDGRLVKAVSSETAAPAEKKDSGPGWLSRFFSALNPMNLFR